MIDPLNTPPPNPTHEGVNQINAIRDILFGQNMENYDQKFKRLHKLVLTHRAEVEGELSKSSTEVLEAIQALEAKLTKQIRRNNEELLLLVNQLEENKVDRKVLGKLLIEIGQKISI